jgi:hypothetical protein
MNSVRFEDNREKAEDVEAGIILQEILSKDKKHNPAIVRRCLRKQKTGFLFLLWL